MKIISYIFIIWRDLYQNIVKINDYGFSLGKIRGVHFDTEVGQWLSYTLKWNILTHNETL